MRKYLDVLKLRNIPDILPIDKMLDITSWSTYLTINYLAYPTAMASYLPSTDIGNLLDSPDCSARYLTIWITCKIPDYVALHNGIVK